jgi:hypothetical protein
MNFEEAMQAMREGKHVSRPGMPFMIRIVRLLTKHSILASNGGPQEHVWNPKHEDVTADDWFIATPPSTVPFVNALSAMLRGKMVRRAGRAERLKLEGDVIVERDADGAYKARVIALEVDDVLSTDWQIVEAA